MLRQCLHLRRVLRMGRAETFLWFLCGGILMLFMEQTRSLTATVKLRADVVQGEDQLLLYKMEQRVHEGLLSEDKANIQAVDSAFLRPEVNNADKSDVNKVPTQPEVYGPLPAEVSEKPIADNFNLPAMDDSMRRALRDESNTETSDEPLQKPLAEDKSFSYRNLFAGSTDIHKSNNIAIGCAITTRGRLSGTTQEELTTLPFFKSLLPSFCTTASEGYNYHFYIAYDFNDPFLTQEGAVQKFHTVFYQIVYRECLKSVKAFIHFVKCSHTKKPAWAQNDAMMEAYYDNMDYYYRINDDTVLKTPGWTEEFIKTLLSYHPPNLGVVGPSYLRRRKRILTYDFVHRTHIDVFGFYYPRSYGDWYADRWITDVYSPGRMKKRPDVKVVHTLAVGTRYRPHRTPVRRMNSRLTNDKNTLQRFLNSSHRYNKPANSTKGKLVISMSLYGSNIKYTYGVVRNAQLRPIVFPEWTLRVYIEKPSRNGSTKHPTVPQKIVKKLIQLGAEIFYIDPKTTHTTPMMWRFLVADDMSVDYFVVRDGDSRLSNRDATVISEWIRSDKPFHCIRDHPSHSKFAVSGGLWGGQPRKLKEIFKESFEEMMRGYKARYLQDMHFLGRVIWPKVKGQAFCHDSFTCEKWESSHRFPVARKHPGEHLGQVFDAYNQPRSNDVIRLKRHAPVFQCAVIPNTQTPVPTKINNAVIPDIFRLYNSSHNAN